MNQKMTTSEQVNSLAGSTNTPIDIHMCISVYAHAPTSDELEFGCDFSFAMGTCVCP